MCVFIGILRIRFTCNKDTNFFFQQSSYWMEPFSAFESSTYLFWCSHLPKKTVPMAFALIVIYSRWLLTLDMDWNIFSKVWWRGWNSQEMGFPFWIKTWQYHDGSNVSYLAKILPGRLSALVLQVYVSSSWVLRHKSWVWDVPHPSPVQPGRTQNPKLLVDSVVKHIHWMLDCCILQMVNS